MIPFPQLNEAIRWLTTNATGPCSVFLFTEGHVMLWNFKGDYSTGCIN